MRFCVLGSGSKGNSTFIEGGDTRILVDAGFSGLELERRLASVGVDPSSLSAIVVTHEHSDHIRGVQALSRRFGLTVLASAATMKAAGNTLAKVARWTEIQAGRTFSLDELVIHPFSVSHDVVDPLGFVIGYQGLSVGYCTDTGSVSRVMQHRLGGCNGLILECNHDPVMLRNGSYPPHLQQRIRSKEGHLANSEAAELLAELIHDGLEHVVLAHLSESNNTPELARREVEIYLNSKGFGECMLRGFVLSVAGQEKTGSMIHLGGRGAGRGF
ncbi:MAG: MBL fold metallo-hydrolase [Proteobacteria bacterium]|nr:MBL fold metallo-hydrolase [Pseudomonadota bacterium]MBU1737635.1 MBL fold metallo-hydrolase [Pseudomonadota bacterium]